LNKLGVICNNFGAHYDGIGDYSSIVYLNFSSKTSVKIYTAKCNRHSPLKRIANLGMTKAICSSFPDIVFKRIDKIIIEYPFIEWNPLIALAFVSLKLLTIFFNVELLSSIHEFKRVNPLRKIITVFLVILSNRVFITSYENKVLLEKFNPNTIKIEIPSNIRICENAIKKNDFVYFGLVNPSKAFKEMILGWNIFNNSGQYNFYILTASEIKDLSNYKNVNVFVNADENVVSQIMASCKFTVLPIRPEVDEKNGTFKTSCIAGNIAVGHFCNQYRKLPFIIEMNNYKVQSFVESFQQCIKLGENDIKNKENLAKKFGEKFNPIFASQNLENLIFK
jgi:hypothetical protein